MTIVSRQPTGLVPYPITVLAGREGTGKSMLSVLATASPLVRGGYWFSYGEIEPDAYGSIEGVNYRIVKHDRTVTSLIETISEVAIEPHGDKPPVLIVDSATRVWNTLVENGQLAADQRELELARRQHRAPVAVKLGDEDWAHIRLRWNQFMLAIKQFRGPVIMTCRLTPPRDWTGEVSVEQKWQIQAPRELVFDANVVLELHEDRQWILRKAQSPAWELDRPVQGRNITLDEIWQQLGVSERAKRIYTEPVHELPEPYVLDRDWAAAARDAADSPRQAELIKHAAQASGAAPEVVAEVSEIAATAKATHAPVSRDSGLQAALAGHI